MLLSLKLAITDTARMQRRVYETVERPSVRLSVCPIIRLQQRRAPGRRNGNSSAATAAKVAADEKLGAASASVRDLTPHGGLPTQIGRGVYRKK